MIPLLQEEPIAPQSDNEDLFYLFISFCAIVIIINVARQIKRRQEEPTFSAESKEANTETEEYGYTTERGETLFDDVKPEDDEVEYKIVGSNYRELSKKDIGYSENFCLNAADLSLIHI